MASLPRRAAAGPRTAPVRAAGRGPMLHAAWAAASILAVLFAPPASSAQPAAAKGKDASSAVDQARIDAAIDRGAKFLLQAAATLPSQGGWHVEKPNSDFWHDELILYTLIHAGTDHNDPVFQKLLDRALTQPLTRTYRVSLTAMALHALGDEEHLPRIVDCAQFLVDNQCENGQWSYGEGGPTPQKTATEGAKPRKAVATSGTGAGASAQPPPPAAGSGTSAAQKPATKTRKRILVAQRRKGPPTGDNSNSQYAALGLRACLEGGVDVQADILKKAKDWWEKQQNGDGGWCYGEEGGTSTGGMSAGAIGSLAIYTYFLREPVKGDPAINKGVPWMSQNFTVRENPHDAPQEWDRQYYFLYAMERVGMLVGTEKLGAHEWYPEGAAYLLEKQQAGGNWHGEKPAHNDVIDTCYAILFLRRATKPLPKIYTR